MGKLGEAKQVFKAFREWVNDTPLRIWGWIMGIIALIVGTLLIAFWLQQHFPPWYVWVGTVLAIIGIIGLSFIPYYNRTQKRLVLLIKRFGISLITDPRKKSSPVKRAYYYDVLLANSSPDKSLGILSISLQLEYKNKMKGFSPHIGDVTNDFGKVLHGEIPNNFRLEPNDSRSGILLFIEDYAGDEVGEAWEEAKIIVTDTQGNDSFSTPFYEIASRGEFPDALIKPY